MNQRHKPIYEQGCPYEPCYFYGNFKDLIPAGFKFCKLYARNYRQYSIELSCRSFRIWQAQGGYVELDNAAEFTQKIVNAVMNKSFQWYQSSNRMFSENPFEATGCMKTGEVIPRLQEHNAMYWYCKKDLTEEQKNAETDRIYRDFRPIRLSSDQFKFIESMVEKGWVKTTG